MNLIAGLFLIFLVEINSCSEDKYLVKIDLNDYNRIDVLYNNNYGDIRYYTTYYCISSVSENNIPLLKPGLTVLEKISEQEKYFLVLIRNEAELEYIKSVSKLLFYDGTTSLIRCSEQTAIKLLTGYRLKLLPEKIVIPKPADYKTFYYKTTKIDEDIPVIKSLLEKITTTQIYNYIYELQSFSSRYTLSTGCIAAENYLITKFNNFGLNVTTMPFIISGTTSYNVIAELPGITLPEKIVIICAHYDSITYTQPEYNAPGADDNASGVSSLLSIAEIISQTGCKFNYTIRFIAFSGEEQGLYGSFYYAQSTKNLDIIAVLNLDMIAYWIKTVPRDLDIISNTNSKWLTEFISQINDKYGTIIPVNIYIDNNAWWSDHSSFWTTGKPSVCFIESYKTGSLEFNPFYHTIQDTIDKLDMSFAKDIIKISAATLFHIADIRSTADEITIIEPDGINDEITKGDNYTIRWLSNGTSTASISLYYCQTLDYRIGKYITTLSSNNNYFIWNTGNIPTGKYYICFLINDTIEKYSSGQVTIFSSDITSKLKVYPNPFKAARDTQITFTNLAKYTKLKIYNIASELVYEKEITDTLSFPWSVCNMSGNKLSSGIYIYYITDDNGHTEKGKLAIIR